MRRFLVEVLLNAVVAFVVLWVLSLIRVPQPFPFGLERAPIMVITGGPLAFLILGAAIALVDRLIRPVIVALTGRWVLSTMGVALLIVNVVSLWIATVFSPQIAVGAQPHLLWFVIGAAALTIVGSLFDAVLGLNVPQVDATGNAHWIWTLLDALPTPRRSRIIENVRLQQVYETIYRFGLDIALEPTPIGRLRRWSQAHLLGGAPAPDGQTREARVRLMLQELGPTYVKIGQMVASRREALPPALALELERLQSDAAPFPWEQAATILEAELGQPPAALFASIETEPFAAASTAQVHRATLPSGERVAVKIQRPYIVAQTKADLGVLEQLALVAEDRWDIAAKLGARAIVHEFAGGVLRELDYRNEAYHAQRIAESMQRFPEIHIPVVDPARSSARVLTAEFVDGIKLSDAERLRAAGLDTKHLGGVFIRALIKQVLIDGFFHGDPHPGNVLVDPATGQIVFLDFGLVGELRTDQRVSLLQLLYALKSADSSAIADALIGLGSPGPAYDERHFRSDIDRLTRQHLVYGKAASFGQAISGVMAAVFDNGLRLDNDLTLAIKAVVQGEETATALGFDIDIAAAAFAEARAATMDRITADEIEKVILGQGMRIGQELVRR